MTGVRAVRADELDAVGAMAARAFQDDPLFAYVVPDAADRRRSTPVHVTAYVRAMHGSGEVWVTGDLAAVACWHRPGEREIPPEVIAASGLDRVAGVIGADAWARMGAVFAYLDLRLVALGVPDHWYLTLVGVEPGRTGGGLGSAVLAPALSRADENGVPAYLETYDERNVRFYERLGFGVAETAVEPSSGLRYWLMLRDPR